MSAVQPQRAEPGQDPAADIPRPGDDGNVRPEARGALRKACEPDERNRPQNYSSMLTPVVVVVVAVPAIAFGTFTLLGADPNPRAADASAASAPTAEAGAHEITSAVAQLRTRLERDPDNRDAWAMLARSYVFLQRYADAVGAYANVYRLTPEPDASLLIDYADAIGMANGRRLTGMPAALIDRALALDPDNVKGLWLSAHRHEQGGDLVKSIDAFRRAILQLPAGSADAAVLQQQLASVESRAAAAGSADMVQPPAAIEVAVELDETLAPEVSGAETVFVFARATDGPRMPLAIAKLQASALPLRVTLDDSLAMSPAIRLSSFPTVDIGARISRSGNATPQAGDLTGSVAEIDLARTDQVTVRIDSRQP